jgi:signal transduction histidine kinase
LHNLLDNAVKYGPADQTISVGVRLDGDRAVITIDDEGAGVPAGERDVIWRPFRRGESDAARAVGGSGIGLSIVRDVVEHHGGTGRIEEAPGGGARFVLEFPGASRTRSDPPGLHRLAGTGRSVIPQ